MFVYRFQATIVLVLLLNRLLLAFGVFTFSIGPIGGMLIPFVGMIICGVIFYKEMKKTLELVSKSKHDVIYKNYPSDISFKLFSFVFSHDVSDTDDIRKIKQHGRFAYLLWLLTFMFMLIFSIVYANL
jgi:hypothetical protein